MKLSAIQIILMILGVILVSQVIIRLVRHFNKFPIPAFMLKMIDNPMRRKIQPPDEMPARHGIQVGMTVLEIGPGNGTYTIGTAQQVGPSGMIIAVDIQPEVIQRLQERVRAESIMNIAGIITDVHHLPYCDGVFDAIYLIAVIGEIPKPQRALREFHRVLALTGVLAFSELLPDPDYPLQKTLTNWAKQAGFELKEKKGNFFMYTLQFHKEISPDA